MEIALAISKEMGFQTMAYDFLFDPVETPYFCEISYSYVDKFVYLAEGYWDEEMNFHLVDLLKRPDLVSL